MAAIARYCWNSATGLALAQPSPTCPTVAADSSQRVAEIRKVEGLVWCVAGLFCMQQLGSYRMQGAESQEANNEIIKYKLIKEKIFIILNF